MLVSSMSGRRDLLFIADKNSGRNFLVDTGAEVSVLPATGLDTRTASRGPNLVATNGNNIKTYGSRTVPLWVGGRRYVLKFILARVTHPLLGADFLRAHSLMVDLKKRRLVDAETYSSVPLGVAGSAAPQLNAIRRDRGKY